MVLKSHDKGLEVLSVLPSGPAQRAGLKEQDIVTHINGVPVAGSGFSESLAKIRGPVGSQVSLEVLEPRHQTKLIIGVVRQVLNTEDVLDFHFKSQESKNR